MIDVSDTVRSVLDGSYEYHIQVQSWLGDQLLADDVPVSAGSEDSDRSLTVPERATFTVPKIVRGVDWTPAGDDSPLAANGPTLKVSLGVGKGPDGVEWFQRCELLISQTTENGDGTTLDVTAVGLLGLVDEAKFVAPFQPDGTIGSTVRALLEPAVTVDLGMAPTDRSVPTSAVNWDSDRLGALGDLLDAWPAVPRMNEGGYLEILPDTVPTAGDAVREFSSGTGGTVITAVGSSSRDGGFNVVVATGTSSDGSELRGLAYVSSGPWSYVGGAANPLPVPYSYSSPLLTTQAQCDDAAQTVLRRKMREAVLRRWTVTAVPDPTIQLGDPVLVDGVLCTVETISLPYFATGPMTLGVVSVS
jgi:hypothetical protein